MKTVEIKQVAITSIETLEELKGFLPETDELAKEKLKKEIENDGIREPLTLAEYNGQTIILDGHNRLDTAKKLHYTEVPAIFHPIEDLNDARQFMLNNQLAKRNVTAKEKILMVLTLEPELKAEALARKKMTKEEKLKVPTLVPQKTINLLAKIAGSSAENIRKIKEIQKTGNSRLLEIADAEISIAKAFEIAMKPKAEREAEIDAALAASKKAGKLEKPEDNRNFECGGVWVENKILRIDFQDEPLEYAGDECYLELDEDEAISIKLIKRASEYYAGIANDLLQACQFYKTPKTAINDEEKKKKREEKQAKKDAKAEALKRKAEEKTTKISAPTKVELTDTGKQTKAEERAIKKAFDALTEEERAKFDALNMGNQEVILGVLGEFEIKKDTARMSKMINRFIELGDRRYRHDTYILITETAKDLGKKLQGKYNSMDELQREKINKIVNAIFETGGISPTKSSVKFHLTSLLKKQDEVKAPAPIKAKKSAKATRQQLIKNMSADFVDGFNDLPANEQDALDDKEKLKEIMPETLTAAEQQSLVDGVANLPEEQQIPAIEKAIEQQK